MDKTVFTTIDEYIAQYTPEIQAMLSELRNTIHTAAPMATEKISWGMATFVLEGNLVHFAGEKNHIGFHPAPSAIEAFREELSGYVCSKGTVRFPYSQALPLDLIGRMVEFRVKEQLTLVEEKKVKRNSRSTAGISDKVYEFDGVIQYMPRQDGAYIEFPYDVGEEFGKGRVKVHATFDGEPYDGSLVRMGTPCHILGVLKGIRAKIGKQPGGMVHVVVRERE